MLSPKALELLWFYFSPQSKLGVSVDALMTVAEIQAWIKAEAAALNTPPNKPLNDPSLVLAPETT